jgi:hypothetical protein
MTRLRPLLMLVALLLAAVAAPIGGVAVRSAAHAADRRGDGRSCAIGSARFVRCWRRHCCNDGR